MKPPALSTAFGITDTADSSRHIWQHNVELHARLLIVDLVILRHGARRVRPKGVRIGGTDLKFTRRFESDDPSTTADREIWTLTNPPIGKLQIEVTGLLDTNGNPVAEGHVEAKSITLPHANQPWSTDETDQKPGVLFLDIDWLGMTPAERGLLGWLPSGKPLLAQRSAVIEAKAWRWFTRPNSMVVTVTADLVRVVRTERASLSKIVELLDLLEAIEAVEVAEMTND